MHRCPGDSFQLMILNKSAFPAELPMNLRAFLYCRTTLKQAQMTSARVWSQVTASSTPRYRRLGRESCPSLASVPLRAEEGTRVFHPGYSFEGLALRASPSASSLNTGTNPSFSHRVSHLTAQREDTSWVHPTTCACFLIRDISPLNIESLRA